MRTTHATCLALVCLILVGATPAWGAFGLPGLQSHTPTPKVVPSELGQRAYAEAESPFGFLGPRRVDGIKAAVATSAAALLLWGAVLRRSGRPQVWRRSRDAALLALGVIALLCWWNLGRFHYPHYQHRSDNYVYVVGAKYFAELGYDRLYHCAAVAEAEAGRGDAFAGRPMRDLATNEMTRARAALDDPDFCKRHFSPERWQAFRSDVAWFRSLTPRKQWRRAQMDHGYNSTPVWGALAIPLANTGPASVARVLVLILLDPLLLLVMWGCVVWAFGWRAACVAAVFWGTNPFAHFGWTGGGFLRQDWLVATVVSLCLLRRGRPLAAGFALACAAFLRAFPLLVFVGLGLGVAATQLRERRLRLAHGPLRIAAGAVLAGALLVPLSIGVVGLDAWPAFVSNSRLHLDTPLRNHMGLKTAISHDPATADAARRTRGGADLFGPWKLARQETFERRQWLFYTLVAGFALLLARGAAGREDWVAATLGIGLIVIAGELTCYYYSVLLAFGLLWTQRESIGVALCGLSAVGWWISSRWHATDEVYALSSAACVAFVLYATAVYAFGREHSHDASVRPA